MWRITPSLAYALALVAPKISARSLGNANSSSTAQSNAWKSLAPAGFSIEWHPASGIHGGSFDANAGITLATSVAALIIDQPRGDPVYPTTNGLPQANVEVRLNSVPAGFGVPRDIYLWGMDEMVAEMTMQTGWHYGTCYLLWHGSRRATIQWQKMDVADVVNATGFNATRPSMSIQGNLSLAELTLQDSEHIDDEVMYSYQMMLQPMTQRAYTLTCLKAMFEIGRHDLKDPVPSTMVAYADGGIFTLENHWYQKTPIFRYAELMTMMHWVSELPYLLSAWRGLKFYMFYKVQDAEHLVVEVTIQRGMEGKPHEIGNVTSTDTGAFNVS